MNEENNTLSGRERGYLCIGALCRRGHTGMMQLIICRCRGKLLPLSPQVKGYMVKGLLCEIAMRQSGGGAV